MTIDGVSTIGFIGAGKIGSQVARAAIAAGYDVVLSNSRGPETLADLVLAAVRGTTEISASEAGEAVGLSRVTARRYLEHFVETGRAEVRLRYGAAGRPERRYRAR